MSYKVTTASGTHYYKDPECTILHRTDGPAVYRSGVKLWYSNGKLHCLNGPAVVWDDIGKRDFYVNDVMHSATDFPTAVANWVSYIEVTKQDIEIIIGKYRIVEW